MRKFRGVRYSLAILMVVNFIAVMLNSIIYLQATNYIIAQRQASLLVERLERIPFAPSTTFWLSALLFAGIALISMSRYRSQTSRWSIFDKWNILEILLMLLLMWVQNVAYNGLISIGFCGYLLWFQRVEYQARPQVLVCVYPSKFLDASCDQFRRLFAFLSDTFSGCLYSFLSCLHSDSGLFLEEFPLCLEYGALHYFAFVLYYECSCGKPRSRRRVGYGFEGQYGVE